MKLLFIENRYKTYFFDKIVKQLIDLGHEVSWIVQNHNFSPKATSKNFIIPYPKNSIVYTPSPEITDIINSDRQINHFAKKDDSYFYYYDKKIREILQEYKPDVIFGEATAFHELLTIKNAKALGVLYLNPTSSRYPVRRFAFYKYDSLEPFIGSEEILSDTEAIQIIESIIHKKVKPDYMHKHKESKTKVLKDLVLKSKSYLFGEKYNTPHPLVKYKLEKRKKKNIALWDSFAVTAIKDSRFRILYPLQMQPESNIDVWGRKHRNQTELITKIVNSLPEDAVLYVKPNPKSKYELSESLIQLVKNTHNTIAVNHGMSMEKVFPKMDMVITVTGTIAIESILSNKPVLTLTKTLNNKAKNAIFIDKCTEITKYIKQVKQGLFPRLAKEEKIAFINLLNTTSFSGIISDPYSDPKCISEENIHLLVNHFSKVLENIVL